MSTLVYDVSEFQRIDWATFGGQAVIVRLSYGDLHVDLQADANIEGARRRCPWRGWYGYLIGGRDPIAQARVFCAVLQAHGGLLPGEVVACDDEEGAGDQAGRVAAFLDFCDQALRIPNPAGEDWWYSGLNFALAHNLPAARGHRWIAAYQAAEPTAIPHELWQATDVAHVVGVAGPLDCSIFHGSLDELMAIGGGGMNIDPNEWKQLREDAHGAATYAMTGDWLDVDTGASVGAPSYNRTQFEIVKAQLAAILSAEGAEAEGIKALEAAAAAGVALKPVLDALTALGAELQALDSAIHGAAGGPVDLSKVYAKQDTLLASLAVLGKHLGQDVTAPATTPS